VGEEQASMLLRVLLVRSEFGEAVATKTLGGWVEKHSNGVAFVEIQFGLTHHNE
jgi:hypothetical protein